MNPDMSLLDAMRGIVVLLESIGEGGWANRVRDDIHFLNRGELYGAQRFLTYFGGMGSLNDLKICRENGHDIELESEQSINEELIQLLDKAYGLATDAIQGAKASGSE